MWASSQVIFGGAQAKVLVQELEEIVRGPGSALRNGHTVRKKDEPIPLREEMNTPSKLGVGYF